MGLLMAQGRRFLVALLALFVVSAMVVVWAMRTKDVTYRVKYADGSPGMATVTYVGPDGKRTEVVETPWISKTWRRSSLEGVSLSAQAEPIDSALLQCTAELAPLIGTGRAVGSADEDSCGATT